MTIGIYKITEKETGRCYIGQTIDIKKRWQEHHKNYPLRYFDYEVLITCDVDYLDFFEKAFIFGYNSHINGFNKTTGGGGWGRRGMKTSDEAKRKMSEAKKNISNETRRKMSEARRRRKTSEETKKKMSISKKGRPQTKFQCPYCNIWCAGNMLHRYHNDNCKKKGA